MGEFVYEGEHSISFSGKDTWEYFRMAPSARPFVAEPSVKTEYVDVPGANGSLDYTEALTGGVRFGDRTGSWNFLVDNGYWEWPLLYSELLSYLHGQKHKIILKDDPDFYYSGRTDIKCNFGTKDFATVQINYRVSPYKYPLNSTALSDWMWKELFNNTIIYGKFNVYKEKARNIINESDSDKSVSITTSAAMTVTFGGETISLPAGTTSDALTIHPGNNEMIFKGSGQVTIDYSTGGKL